MYVVRILYPRTPGSTFNLRHYIDVHTPLGLGLLKSNYGVSPVRVEIDAEPIALSPDPPPYHCTSSLYFGQLSDVEAFKALSTRADTAKMLADDFHFYTTNRPVISVSKLLLVDL